MQTSVTYCCVQAKFYICIRLKNIIQVDMGAAYCMEAVRWPQKQKIIVFWEKEESETSQTSQGMQKPIFCL